MTASYIIWHEKIWVKYIVRAFWQIGLSYVERILKIKIHSCNDRSQDLIGSIIIYKDIIGQESNWILSKWFCSTCRQLDKLKKSKWPKQGQRTRQKAHHPNSFHCCHRKDPSHVYILSWSSLSVRAPVRSVLGVSALESSFRKRESSRTRGDSHILTPLCSISLSLFL
jgi:hypothetical protein